jgi:hypothetical protein
MAGMSKQQTGLRIERVLFKRFQQLCAVEKLRPGEAVESLVRLAVDTGSVAAVSANAARQVRHGTALDEALFRSRLSRLKSTLESERRYWMETGEEIEEPDSEELVRELTELGRRSVSEELVKEFESSLTELDKLYEDIGRSRIERWIKEA